ncbi:MAG: hypothetical protein ACE5H9_04015 [Anaerolineae bacterium]
MEFAHLESRLNFLDDEYRQEKRELAQLRQTVDSQRAEIEEYHQRVQTLESELARVQAQMQRLDRTEDMMQRFKNEVMAMLEDQDSRRRQAFKDADRARQMELDSHAKALNEIRRDVERNRRFDEDLALARTEVERLGALVVSMQQRLDHLAKQNDERVRAVGYLENQRNNDAKKIAQLQAEVADLFKRINLSASKLEMVEKQMPEFAKFKQAVDGIDENTRRSLENYQYQAAQFERQVRNWTEQADGYQRRMDDYEARMDRYAEHYQLNRKALESLQEFQERLQRDQHEAMELQRLAEERARHRLEEWQNAEEQRRHREALEWEHRFKTLHKGVEKTRARVAIIEEIVQSLQPQINLLIQLAEEDAQSRLMAAREWLHHLESLATDEGK